MPTTSGPLTKEVRLAIPTASSSRSSSKSRGSDSIHAPRTCSVTNLTTASRAADGAIQSNQALQELKQFSRTFSLPNLIRPGVAWVPYTTEKELSQSPTVSSFGGSNQSSTPCASSLSAPSFSSLSTYSSSASPASPSFSNLVPLPEDYSPSIYSGDFDGFIPSVPAIAAQVARSSKSSVPKLARPFSPKRGYTHVANEVDQVIDMYDGLSGKPAPEHIIDCINHRRVMSEPSVDVVETGQTGVFPLRRDSLRRSTSLAWKPKLLADTVGLYRDLVVEPVKEASYQSEMWH